LHEPLELGIELGLLLFEPVVLAAHVAAEPYCSVELVEEAAVDATEVNHPRPQLAELPLLAHALPPGGLPVGDHPPPPPLRLRHYYTAAVDVFHATRAGRCFADDRFVGSRWEVEGRGNHGVHVAVVMSVECWWVWW
jgi:hypothetical protein